MDESNGRPPAHGPRTTALIDPDRHQLPAPTAVPGPRSAVTLTNAEHLSSPMGAEVRSGHPSASVSGTPYLRSALLAAVLLGFTLSLIAAFSVKPFRPADENAHVGYAESIVQQGRLPVLTEKVVPILDHQSAGPQHTANHPPLFYLTAAPLLKFGEVVGRPMLGFYAGRILSALFGALTVLLSGLLAFDLTGRRRPGVAVGAAIYVATFAPFSAIAGFFHNDSLGAATSTLALLGLARMALSRSFRARRWAMAAMVLGCVLGLLTRAQNVGTLGVCCLGVVLIAATRNGRWSWSRRTVRTGLAQGVLIGMCCIIFAGWFYVRNLVRYGDVTGSGAVIELLRRTPRAGSLVGELGRPGTWLTLLIDQPYWVGHDHQPSATAPIWLSVAGVGVIGLGLLAWAVNQWQQLRVRSTYLRSAVPVLLVRWLLGALVVLGVVEGAAHVLAGGGLHGRYLFGAIGIVGTVAAVAMLALPGGRRGGAMVGLAVLQAVITLRYVGFVGTTRSGAARPTPGSTPTRIISGLRVNGVPDAALVFWLLAAVVFAAMAWTAYAMRQLADQPGSPTNQRRSRPRRLAGARLPTRGDSGAPDAGNSSAELLATGARGDPRWRRSAPVDPIEGGQQPTALFGVERACPGDASA
jgi:hypothetical protein